ncbi:hypothetical protein HL42_2764 [Trichophyton rubrum]|nr:hypothetical protein HL42_2764 [Trichophyton rubrum]
MDAGEKETPRKAVNVEYYLVLSCLVGALCDCILRKVLAKFLQNQATRRKAQWASSFVSQLHFPSQNNPVRPAKCEGQPGAEEMTLRV